MPAERTSTRAREPILERVWEELVGLARSVDSRAELVGRVKEATSLRAKARRLRGKRVLDSVGVRIVVHEPMQCYRVMLRLHREYPALIDEYDDYIVNPKPNGYRSLHTILLTPDRDPVEVQVRTREMHRDAVEGHSAYKRDQWSADLGLMNDALTS